ncbi:MAG: hypothetical protein KC729_13245, partial [Candidatus Eisenbacteria bacterium]|nr:hypothetical protein [Candidatus Eisenbacteria bacterium]
VAQMAVPVGAPVTVESPFDPSFALWTSANPGPRPALHYALTTSGPVRLAIYDGTGRALGSVLEQAASGAHTVEWESWASARAPLPAGIYWVRLEALHQDRIVRLTVVR